VFCGGAQGWYIRFIDIIKRTVELNFLEVPSMQTTRFRLADGWAGSADSWTGGAGWTTVGPVDDTPAIMTKERIWLTTVADTYQEGF
jgi:hypothetical protein